MQIPIIATAVAVLSFAAPLSAQTSAEAFDPRADDDIVVTATGFAAPRDETGQAIAVIDRERLDTLQSLTVADALETLPGVRVAERGPIGSQTSLFVRGANSSQTLVLIDGVRVNDPSGPNAAFDFGALLADGVGRIELLRGPNSIVWGSQAIGGVVAVDTLSATRGPTARAALEYGSLDTVRASLGLAGTSGPVQAAFNGGFLRSDGISALVGGAERDGYRNATASGRLRVALGRDAGISFGAFYTDGRVEYDSPFGVGADALPVSDNSQLVGSVAVTLNAPDGRWRSRIAYSRSVIDRIGTDPVAFSFNNFVARGRIDRLEFRGAIDIAPSATLVFGLEHERTFASTSFEGAPADRARNRVSGGFAQVVVRPLAGVTLTGGMRHDHYDDYGGQTTFGANFAWVLGSGGTVVRATFAQGFRAPTLTEGQPPFGNPDLRPETAENFDIGIEQRLLGDSLTASVTMFRRRSDDLIAFSLATFRSENIERVHSDGLEISLVARPVNALDLQLSYALVDAVNRSPGTAFGNRLALRPQHSLFASGDWRTPWGLLLGGSVQLVGDSFDDAANMVRLDGYALASVRASFPLSERLELFGRIENLFDAAYTVVAGYGTYGRTAAIGVRARL